MWLLHAAYCAGLWFRPGWTQWIAPLHARWWGDSPTTGLTTLLWWVLRQSTHKWEPQVISVGRRTRRRQRPMNLFNLLIKSILMKCTFCVDNHGGKRIRRVPANPCALQRLIYRVKYICRMNELWKYRLSRMPMYHLKCWLAQPGRTTESLKGRYDLSEWPPRRLQCMVQ